MSRETTEDHDQLTYHIVDCQNLECQLCPLVYRAEPEAVDTAKAHKDVDDVWVTDVTADV